MSIQLLLKGILFFMNFVYWFFGGTTMLMGVYLFMVKVRILHRYLDLAFDPAVFLVVVGCLVFVIAGLGFVGVLRENTCFLRAYGLCLSCILSAAFVAVLTVVWPTLSPSDSSRLESVLRRAVVIYRDDPDMEDLVNTLQSSLRCCGITHRGYLDWQHNAYFNCSQSNPSRERCGVPYSCCRDRGHLPSVMCGYGVMDTSRRSFASVERSVYTQGCLQALADLVRENLSLVSAVSAVAVGSLAVGVAGAWFLVESIDEVRRAVTLQSRAVTQSMACIEQV
ncbi:tetraspanin-33 [Rhipicephalus sanguineus]|uniref:Tetraspanin n=1 Tax=Rhipicephalus sanguineus TaxID=34632 RepID=A0A9D4T8S1_RHISA|nr:tetraspanin-33 [Rhipicephalus sanguineus]KAH7982771.1 hypothetical protein HPB52_007018 [Rhipicephalus sanguineus]